MRILALGGGAALLVLGLVATEVAAATLKCQRTIAKASSQFAQARATALRKCEEAVVATGAGGPCPDGNATEAIAKATAKLTAVVGQACGGADRVCGGDLTGEDLPATLGWPDRCPNFERGGCDGDITDCAGIVSCLACLDAAAVDQAMGLYYGELLLPSTGALERCQIAIGKATTAFLKAKSRALQKCWDARMHGRFSGTCIDPDPGDGKYQAAIQKLEIKNRHAICRACGGPDGLCDGVNDIGPPTIGFPTTCPAVTVPGGTACGGPIPDLDSLVTCLECVTEFKVDCLDRAQVPQLAPYPNECNACLKPAPTGACPTSMELTVDGAHSDLDFGWSGFMHDLKTPSDVRLTFAVSGCAGTSQPTCGECAADGPITNAGGSAFDYHRCLDQPWVTCGTDGDCTTAGATGPCVYFLGPPQPVAAGFGMCLVSHIAGPIAGTVNVDTGSVVLPASIVRGVHFPGGPIDHPCPICDRICLGGSNDGFPCTSDAECDGAACSPTTVCSSGTRALQACSPQAATTFGNVSLDCPPHPASLAGSPQAFAMHLATDVQSRTLTAASPPCRQTGFTSLACFCDTCNDANAEPCASNADCPLSGGNPGICGGRRCIGGPNDGAPCEGAASQCPGGACTRPGEAVQPSFCSENPDAPGINCVDAGDGEGVCAAGPFDAVCSIEGFRPCGSDADCNPPPAGTCDHCASGQSCISRALRCFPDNGLIGNSVSVTGSADVPCGGIAHPTVGALFCMPPVGGSIPDVLQGLPGLGRVRLEGALRFAP